MLRRHRVRGRHADVKKIVAFLKDKFPNIYQRIRFPETIAIGIKPICARYRAAGALGDRVRHHQPPQERDAGAQGKHHEVHRGGLPELGLRPGASGFASQTATWNQWEKAKAQKGASEANAEQKAARRREGSDQGCDRRHHAAAGAHAARRVRRHRHAQSQRRLPVRRARGPGRRHRHRTGRQHQLPEPAMPSSRRPTALRPEVREPGQGQPGLGDPLAAR